MRMGAIGAGVVLGMFAAYQLALAGGALVTLTIPIALAVFVIGTLATLRPAERGAAPENIIGWERFELEFERSRRYERPLALLRISLPARPRDRQRADALEVRKAVRMLDAVWTDRDCVVVLMPETNREALARAIGRILARLPGAGLDAMRVALYPDDGITSGALVGRLDDPGAEPLPAEIVHLAPAPHNVEEQDRTG